MVYLREFDHGDGEVRTDLTYRTPLIETYVDPAGRSFLDLGAADGYESRALVLRGAGRAVAIEGKAESYGYALEARDHLALGNLDVLEADIRRVDELVDPLDVTLCFGLLYHLENPFNVLKRIRTVTRELLLLETHVAPHTMSGLLPKHLEILGEARRAEVELDGLAVRGLLVPHVGDLAATKGSLDAGMTLWLEPGSLVAAVTRAGFTITHYIDHIDQTLPATVQKYGALLGFGHANTKVWIVARPDGPMPEITAPTERILELEPAPRRRRRFR